MTTPAHLAVTTSERGFDALPEIPSEYGGHVSVYESSAAVGPHIWLKAVDVDPDGTRRAATLHLTADNATKLAEQLTFLVRNHYQGHDGR